MESQAPQKIRKEKPNFVPNQPGTSFLIQTEAVGAAFLPLGFPKEPCSLSPQTVYKAV